MSADGRLPGHLYALDALRGIAALAVVAFHYANFFTVQDILPASFVRSSLPFYHLAPLVFEDGWLAVDLFFTLSGFVFFWLYAEKIVARAVAASDFAWLRFSRLYPLHLATLLLTAAGQWAYGALHPDSPFFVYRFNTLGNFVLQLLFASSWWPGADFSFNGPTWSISIEVLLYAIFFLCCRFLSIRNVFLAAMAVAGFWLVYRVHTPLGRGIGSFFLGGLTFRAWRAMQHSPHRLAWTFAVSAAAIVLMAVGILGMSTHWNFLDDYWQHRVARYFPLVGMFPALILALALLDAQTGLGRHVSWLGDISYSTYLLHFPLQLAFVLVTDAAGLGRAVYLSPWMFLLFYAVLVPLALASFRVFERPVQRMLRRGDRRQLAAAKTA